MEMHNSHSGSSHLNHLISQGQDYSASNMTDTTLLNSADVDGLMTLFMNNHSTRKLAKTVIQYNGAAVLGALAYKAHENWQSNKPLHEVESITGHDVTQASLLPQFVDQPLNDYEAELLATLMKAMVAASSIAEAGDNEQQQQLLKAAQQLGFNATDTAFIHELINREITIQEIAQGITLDKHKSEVYLATYTAIVGNNQDEHDFLIGLASALDLPSGLTTYLEHQADLGITA